MDAHFKKGPPWLRSRTILLTRAGSHSYGTALPSSDIDLRGVAIAPREIYLGFSDRFERSRGTSPDCEITELRLFLHAAAIGEPNVLQVLFCEDEDVLFADSLLGARLRELAPAFLSKAMARPFAGHARGLVAKVLHQSKLEVPERDIAKDAMHAVRLVRMLKEVLLEGQLRVRRPDAGLLLTIRKDPSNALGWAQHAEAVLAALPEWLAQSALPDQPNFPALNAVCAAMVQSSFAGLGPVARPSAALPVAP